MSKTNNALTDAQYQIVKILVEALRALFLSWLESADPSASMRRSLQATLKALDVYLARCTIIPGDEAETIALRRVICDPGPIVVQRRIRIFTPSIITPPHSIHAMRCHAKSNHGELDPSRFRTKIASIAAPSFRDLFVTIP